MEPWNELSGKVVMVTGASAGLGKDFCLDLARAGCKIVAAARRIDRLKSLCDQINHSQSSPTAVAVQLDVSANGQIIQESVRKAWAAFGRIDALLNNAGVRGKFLETGHYLRVLERTLKMMFSKLPNSVYNI